MTWRLWCWHVWYQVCDRAAGVGWWPARVVRHIDRVLNWWYGTPPLPRVDPEEWAAWEQRRAQTREFVRLAKEAMRKYGL
jgi:hypothetical protein